MTHKPVDDKESLIDAIAAVRREKNFVIIGLIPTVFFFIPLLLVPPENYLPINLTILLTLISILIGIFLSLSSQIVLIASMVPSINELYLHVRLMSSKIDLLLNHLMPKSLTSKVRKELMERNKELMELHELNTSINLRVIAINRGVRDKQWACISLMGFYLGVALSSQIFAFFLQRVVTKLAA